MFSKTLIRNLHIFNIKILTMLYNDTITGIVLDSSIFQNFPQQTHYVLTKTGEV